MPQPSHPAPVRPVRGRSLRVGFLAVTDAAPFVVAQELGFFTRHGLNVELRREIGWATVRDKLIFGELDAAQAPAPLLWSIELGLGCTPCRVCTPLILSLNGNALTLSQALWAAGVRDATTLRAHLQHRSRREQVTFGVGFLYSAGHLLLRDWLRAGGIDPDKDVRTVVVPHAQMPRHLAAGTLDGYYAEEPWNSVSIQSGAGWCATTSAIQQPGHVDKVLLTTANFANQRPGELLALIGALVQAGTWCADPQHRDELAGMLSESRYLNLPPAALLAALGGKFDFGNGRIEAAGDFQVFSGGETNVPTAAKASSLQRTLVQTGLLSAASAADAALPLRLFRDDLYQQAMAAASRPATRSGESRSNGTRVGDLAGEPASATSRPA
jgi:ABC-type nitrate/sulfonate/bicarbonate transport system substrate-binding protein